MPVRIQRQRTKGWIAPLGAIYVGRPTRWGNPFWHAQQFHGIDLALALYRQMCSGGWDPSLVKDIPTASSIYKEHCEWLRRTGPATKIEDNIRHELRGKDLMCWCNLSAKCHATILLEIANE